MRPMRFGRTGSKQSLVSRRSSGAGLDPEQTVAWLRGIRRGYGECRVLIEVTDGPGALGSPLKCAGRNAAGSE